MASLGRATTYATLALALLAASAPARSEDAGEYKPIDLFAGISFGTDSNIIRASDDPPSSALQEFLAGVGLRAGASRSRLDLRAQYRHNLFTSAPEYDFGETRTSLHYLGGSETISFSVTGAYEQLVDPTAAEATDLLERTLISYQPKIDFAIGTTGLGLGLSSRSIDYAEAAYDGLDHTRSGLHAELRWSPRRAGGLFARLDDYSYEYVTNTPRDFDQQRIYLGWRHETPRKSGIEIGLGNDSISTFDSSGLYAVFRSTTIIKGGAASIDLVFNSGLEAAVGADFKETTRILLRYSESLNRRMRWRVSVMSESSDLTGSDFGLTSIKYLEAGGGLDIDFASGRLFATVGYETREGGSASSSFDRLRLLLGLAYRH